LIVGAGYGADAVNAAMQPIQAQMISSIGLDALTKLNLVSRLFCSSTTGSEKQGRTGIAHSYERPVFSP